MNMPFPGMDPYLEHPVLWEGVHSRLINTIAEQIQPRLDPRYVTSVEERVFVEGPQRRIPDIWIERPLRDEGPATAAQLDADTALIVEVEDLEIHETRVEILDLYDDMKLVGVIEVLSPTNKTKGPGRDSYLKKQEELLARDCHLIEIDLLRRGTHTVAIPEWRLRQEVPANDYLVCVSRFPHRNRYELYPIRLRNRLPRIKVPLASPDPDATLDLQAALEHVYHVARYARRVRYDQPCEPPLTADDQAWANQCWTAYQAAHPELLPPGTPANL
jgi:hypothetical protein